MALSRPESVNSPRMPPSGAESRATLEDATDFQPVLPTGTERRRSNREPQTTVATLQPVNGDASVDRQVLVFNLSLGGVGFRAAVRFLPGESYRITLGTGPLFLNARLRIVSCRARPDGTFDVGAAFC
jgi:hypothetical protein